MKTQIKRNYRRLKLARQRAARPNVVEYGQSVLKQFEVRTRSEVAKIMGMTNEGVRQVENRALAKLCAAYSRIVKEKRNSESDSTGYWTQIGMTPVKGNCA